MIDTAGADFQRVLHEADKVKKHMEYFDHAAEHLRSLRSDGLADNLTELKGHVGALLDEIEGLYESAKRDV